MFQFICPKTVFDDVWSSQQCMCHADQLALSKSEKLSDAPPIFFSRLLSLQQEGSRINSQPSQGAGGMKRVNVFLIVLLGFRRNEL